MELNRRKLLQYGGGTMTLPLLSGTADAREPQEPPEITDSVLEELGHTVEAVADFADKPRPTLQRSANSIGEVYAETSDALGLENIHQLETASVVAEPTARVLVKTLEVCRESFGIGISSMRFARTLFSASSIGGVVMGLAAVGEAAQKLYAANQLRGVPVAKIDGELYRDYLLSILGLAIEVALIPVPFSYKPAWRGTRFVANRTILRVRRFVQNDYADAAISVIMSIMHWAQRALIDHALTSPEVTGDILSDFSHLVNEHVTEVRQDCSLEIPTDYDGFLIMDTSAQAFQNGIQIFIKSGDTEYEKLASFLGPELSAIGVDSKLSSD